MCDNNIDAFLGRFYLGCFLATLIALPHFSPQDDYTVFIKPLIIYYLLTCNFCLLQHEAAKTMQDAINEFAGTPEEIKYVYIYYMLRF